MNSWEYTLVFQQPNIVFLCCLNIWTFAFEICVVSRWQLQWMKSQLGFLFIDVSASNGNTQTQLALLDVCETLIFMPLSQYMIFYGFSLFSYQNMKGHHMVIRYEGHKLWIITRLSIEWIIRRSASVQCGESHDSSNVYPALDLPWQTLDPRPAQLLIQRQRQMLVQLLRMWHPHLHWTHQLQWPVATRERRADIIMRPNQEQLNQS